MSNASAAATEPDEFEALAASVIMRLHAALVAKEALQSTPQLWRAVSIEEQLFQYTNASAGKRKNHDFQHDAALVSAYERTAADLVGYLESKEDLRGWETLVKHQPAGKMRSAFREYLADRGIASPAKPRTTKKAKDEVTSTVAGSSKKRKAAKPASESGTKRKAVKPKAETGTARHRRELPPLASSSALISSRS